MPGQGEQSWDPEEGRGCPRPLRCGKGPPERGWSSIRPPPLAPAVAQMGDGVAGEGRLVAGCQGRRSLVGWRTA